MEDEFSEFESYCSECGEETRKKFVGRDDEYFVYECSLCQTEEELEEEDMEDIWEDEWDEWKKDWEE